MLFLFQWNVKLILCLFLYYNTSVVIPKVE